MPKAEESMATDHPVSSASVGKSVGSSSASVSDSGRREGIEGGY